MDEVLQSSRVFTNVANGEFAKKADMKKAFGTVKEADICLEVRSTGGSPAQFALARRPMLSPPQRCCVLPRPGGCAPRCDMPRHPVATHPGP